LSPNEVIAILARHGWNSSFPEFRDASPGYVRGALERFVREVSSEQVRAWEESIPQLQLEVGEVLETDATAASHTAILEYELPLESRRPDVILLVRGAVVVLELKGKKKPSQADVDQASAYARDLMCYHRHCAGKSVHAVVVPMHESGYQGVRGGVHVTGPDGLDALIQKLQPDWGKSVLTASEFLSEDAYRPLPTLVHAARELMRTGELRRIHRAHAATEPALKELKRIVHEAAQTKSRRLVLLTGVPGAGKTLVGLQLVHAHFLDDLSVPRANGKPTAPAVFLSGNGPLVEVLQYELRGAGGDGKAFVRDVKNYVKKYSGGKHLVPPEHVLVFDEAQRAWDKDRVAEKHIDQPIPKSEPEHFVEFAERIPEWCVVVGLIGSGQEIHIGEEGGLVQWREAVEGCQDPEQWIVHAPPGIQPVFEGSPVPIVTSPALSLDTEIRFHLTSEIHRFVALLLESEDHAVELRDISGRLEQSGYHLRLTRDLDHAKKYLMDRYGENADARFGILASSKDKDLHRLGIPNDYQSTKRLRVGPWYGDGQEKSNSCRRMRDVITEFQAQGLELDAALLAWGTDFVREEGKWSIERARGYKRGARIKDSFQLRVNSYRVLLTRGRDGTVVFVPPLVELNETSDYLGGVGFRMLEE